MKETWKPVPDTDGWYEVSNLGRIRSIDRVIKHKKDRWSDGKTQTVKGRIRKPQLHKYGKGYFYIQMFKGSQHKKKYIHRAVAEAFMPNPLNKREVNHIDGDTRNNNLDNLEWVTPTENVRHSYETGLQNRRKAVKRISLDGQVKMYESLKHAGNDGFVARQLIKKCCLGEKESYLGYKWKYID